MFKRNTGYQQSELFGFESDLTKKQKLYLHQSTEFTFFKEIFPRINESKFAHLYSSSKSRPNAPINQLVGALILKHLYDWTYAELFKNLTFNNLTRYAIGISNSRADIFSEATIFNFQNRVIKHFEETGKDLVTEVFDSLTAGQLEQFNISTNIQRGDSFLVDSKVIDYSRLRLFIEVLKRLSRVLEGEVKKVFCTLVSQYENKTAGQYVYEISRENLPSELTQIASIYLDIYYLIEEIKNDSLEFKNFKRVFSEYFIVDDTKIELKQPSESKSSNLKSPDDPEATFSAKYGKGHIGYSTHISETANEENKINLITDVVVVKNNVSDDKILEQRIPILKDKTPTLSEYFADGAYGNEQIDILNKAHGITQYQTNVKGRKSDANLRIKKIGEDVTVTCAGGQIIKAHKTEKQYRVFFDAEKCKNCPLNALCKLKRMGGKGAVKKRYYYFDNKNILAHERFQNIEKLPPERRQTRSNVEATVKELKRGMRNGKVRINHRIRVSFHMAFNAIAVNLRRIHLKTKKVYQNTTCELEWELTVWINIEKLNKPIMKHNQKIRKIA
ncbi:MAG: transposase [Saprospiraceae bacterium]|nr:transposase [Saprospiraceae bacterium]